MTICTQCRFGYQALDGDDELDGVMRGLCELCTEEQASDNAPTERTTDTPPLPLYDPGYGDLALEQERKWKAGTPVRWYWRRNDER